MALLLFIDDNPETLELLGQAAWLIGHQSLSSLSSEKGLELALTRTPDVIFIDYNLTNTSADRLVAEFRKLDHLFFTPIVVLSAAMTGDQINRALAAGANCCMQKPVSLDELSQTITNIIRN
jgi:DNA-binding response OmpR family regulator